MQSSAAKPPRIASPLADELRHVASRLRRRLLDQAGNGDLTSSQTSVLVQLEKHGPATTSALARAQGMRPQSMATIVAALTAAGLVSGTADPADGRQTILSLTDACRAWLSESRAVRRDWLTRAIESALSAAEQQQLADAMPLLRRLLDE